MEIVKVYSTIDDKNIKNNLKNSLMWKNSYHADDLDNAIKTHDILYEYTIKFDGITPVQVTNVKKITK